MDKAPATDEHSCDSASPVNAMKIMHEGPGVAKQLLRCRKAFDANQAYLVAALQCCPGWNTGTWVHAHCAAFLASAVSLRGPYPCHK